MRRRVAFLVFALVLASAGTARAQTQELSDYLAIAPASGVGSVLEVGSRPGEQASTLMTVANLSPRLSLRVRFAVESVPSEVPLTAGEDPADWMRPSEDTIVLERGSTRPITVRLDVPKSAPAGTRRALITAEIEQATDQRGDLMTGITQRVTMPVDVTVRGEPKPDLAIVSVQSVLRDEKPMLEVALRNRGGVATTGRGVLTVGSAATSFAVASLGGGQDRTQMLAWTPPEDGTIPVVVSIDYALRDTATWSGQLSAASAAEPAPPSGGTRAPTTNGTGRGGGGGFGFELTWLLPLGAVAAVAWLVVELRKSPSGRRPARASRERRVVTPVPLEQLVRDEVAAVTSRGPPFAGPPAPVELAPVEGQLGRIADALERVVDFIVTSLPDIAAPTTVGDGAPTAQPEVATVADADMPGPVVPGPVVPGPVVPAVTLAPDVVARLEEIAATHDATQAIAQPVTDAPSVLRTAPGDEPIEAALVEIEPTGGADVGEPLDEPGPTSEAIDPVVPRFYPPTVLPADDDVTNTPR